MNCQFHSPTDRTRNVRTAGALLVIVASAIFLALPSAARNSSPWKDKDWTQWTVDDAIQILTDSPWASELSYREPYTAEEANWKGPTAVILSSLVVRQALARYRQQDAPCLTESFDDRIIVRFSEQDIFKKPPDLDVSGKKISPLAEHRANSAGCSFGSDAAEFSYPRFVNGKSVFKNGSNSLVINADGLVVPFTIETSKLDTRFTFNTKNMVYKGKPDF